MDLFIQICTVIMAIGVVMVVYNLIMWIRLGGAVSYKRMFCKHEWREGNIDAPHILPIVTWGYFCKKCGLYNGTDNK